MSSAQQHEQSPKRYSSVIVFLTLIVGVVIGWVLVRSFDGMLGEGIITMYQDLERGPGGLFPIVISTSEGNTAGLEIVHWTDLSSKLSMENTELFIEEGEFEFGAPEQEWYEIHLRRFEGLGTLVELRSYNGDRHLGTYEYVCTDSGVVPIVARLRRLDD